MFRIISNEAETGQNNDKAEGEKCNRSKIGIPHADRAVLVKTGFMMAGMKKLRAARPEKDKCHNNKRQYPLHREHITPAHRSCQITMPGFRNLPVSKISRRIS